MIPYDRSEEPPLVAMNCTITNPVTRKHQQRLGKFDTGAALTTIPESLVSELGLIEYDRVSMTDYMGVTTEHPVFLANVSLNGFDFEWCSVCACPRQSILVARDVLNQLNVLLYGPALQFIVSWP